MVYFPRYHSKIWLKPIKEHLFLWEGGEAEESLPGFTSTTQPRCCKIPSRHDFLNKSARREGMVLSPLTKRNVSHRKTKGKELTLGFWQWFPLWTSLSCVSLSTELVSHASNRSHTEAGAFLGNFQRNIKFVGAEVVLYHNFLGKTLHVMLFSLC